MTLTSQMTSQNLVLLRSVMTLRNQAAYEALRAYLAGLLLAPRDRPMPLFRSHFGPTWKPSY